MHFNRFQPIFPIFILKVIEKWNLQKFGTRKMLKSFNSNVLCFFFIFKSFLDEMNLKFRRFFQNSSDFSGFFGLTL